MRKCIVIVLLCSAGLQAAEGVQNRAKKLFVASVAALTSAATADAATSWGKSETNPILGRSQFGMRQTGIKFGMVSAAVVGQCFILRHTHGKVTTGFAALNFASAGVLGAVALHNSTVPRYSATQSH